MSAFGRELASRGSRTGRISYNDFGNGRAASSTTAYGYHVTYEYRDASGRTTGYTDYFQHDDTNSRTSDAYNANEEFVGSKTVVTGPDEGGSLGGPVNGTGPSVGQAAGISNLDLLRQFGEGQSAGGGPNQMLNGRLGNNQVRPIGETGTSFGGPNRNGINISINPEESVRGGNNTTGGGDRPE